MSYERLRFSLPHVTDSVAACSIHEIFRDLADGRLYQPEAILLSLYINNGEVTRDQVKAIIKERKTDKGNSPSIGSVRTVISEARSILDKRSARRLAIYSVNARGVYILSPHLMENEAILPRLLREQMPRVPDEAGDLVRYAHKVTPMSSSSFRLVMRVPMCVLEVFDAFARFPNTRMNTDTIKRIVWPTCYSTYSDEVIWVYRSRIQSVILDRYNQERGKAVGLVNTGEREYTLVTDTMSPKIKRNY